MILMPHASRQNEIYLGSIAVRWMSRMCDGQASSANRLLARDCGFLGFDVEKHSTIYVAVRQVTKLPELTVSSIFAAENAVVLTAELADTTAANRVYNIFFRFQLSNISKIHFCRWEELSLESQWSQLELEKVAFQTGLTDTVTDNLSYWL